MKKLLSYLIPIIIGVLAIVFLKNFLQYFIPIVCLMAIGLIYELGRAVEMPEDFE